MADSTPLDGLIEQAKSGGLSVSFSDQVVVNADEFVYIERDCEAFKEKIRELQQLAQKIADREYWGLGEDKDGLKSAKTLVDSFRKKAGGGSGSFQTNVKDVLEEHYKIVDDIQILHRVIAQKYRDQDAAFAAEYDRLMADMPESPIRKVNGKMVVFPLPVGQS